MANTAEQLENYVGGVPAAQLMKVWDRVEPLLKRVVKPDTGYTPEHVLTELQLNKMQLWVVNDFQAICVSTIIVKPLENVFFVPYLAGDNMDDWLPDLGAFLAERGRDAKCASVEFEGRKGWGKINKHFPEYKPLRVTYRRKL